MTSPGPRGPAEATDEGVLRLGLDDDARRGAP